MNFEAYAPYLVAAGVAIAVAVIGGLATDIGPWYRALRKPSWQPPDWLFGPAWTTIFTLAALSAAWAWKAAPDAGDRFALVAAFLLNVVLNIAWSLLFFRLRRPDWALVEVVILFLSILLIIFVVRPYSPVSAWLLAPYAVWVAFASVLNLTIVRLNGRSFGASGG
jgi:tryptophan-rich sensory protein